MFTEKTIASKIPLNVMTGPASGLPLVLLHGVNRCWQDYISLLPSLSARWQVHGLDFRAHGKSGRAPGRYLVTDYVEDAVELLRDLGKPAVIYGHSLGAMVAAGAAAAEPDLVRAIVLEDPPFDTMGVQITDTPWHTQFTATRAALAGCEGSIDILSQMLGDIHLPLRTGVIRLGDVRDATALRFAASCLLKIDPELLNPIIEGRWLDGFSVLQIARSIRCPALLMQADETAGGMLPDADAARAVNAMRHGILVRVPKVGHLMHWAQPDTVLRLTNGFLESI